MSQLSRCKLTRVRKTVEETVWKDVLTTICRSEDLTVPPLVGCCRWNHGVSNVTIRHSNLESMLSEAQHHPHLNQSSHLIHHADLHSSLSHSIPKISAYSWWNCQATQNRLQIEINYYPDSLLFVSAGFLPRVSSQRLN